MALAPRTLQNMLERFEIERAALAALAKDRLRQASDSRGDLLLDRRGRLFSWGVGAASASTGRKAQIRSLTATNARDIAPKTIARAVTGTLRRRAMASGLAAAAPETGHRTRAQIAALRNLLEQFRAALYRHAQRRCHGNLLIK